MGRNRRSIGTEDQLKQRICRNSKISTNTGSVLTQRQWEQRIGRISRNRESVATVGSVSVFLLILCSYCSYCPYWSSVPTDRTVPTDPTVPADPPFLLILCSYCPYWSHCSFWSSIPTDPTKILPILCFYPSSVPTVPSVPVFLLILFSCWSYWPCVPTVYPHSNYFPMTSVRSSYTSNEPIWVYHELSSSGPRGNFD